ncbi:MAG: hypothetical protein L0G25_07945 [Psychrobacter sp.]|nr:hypothetical protein [Psychrobacter sp.]
MTILPKNDSPKSNCSLAQTCAITFQGNASNQRQQDAIFFVDDWYQETLGITEIVGINSPFCLAVSDGYATAKFKKN